MLAQTGKGLCLRSVCDAVRQNGAWLQMGTDYSRLHRLHESAQHHPLTFEQTLSLNNTLIALVPLLLSVAAIALWRQSALRAGLLGIVGTVGIILTSSSYQLSLPSAVQSLSTGAYNTLNISLVLLGGVSLYRVLEKSGALQEIANSIIAAIAEPVHRLLALVLGASVFFESATGFGVGIVVVAPLYIALGYAPLQAAVLALLGQCAVPWGALSVGTVLGAEISGIPEARLGLLTAVFNFPITALFGFAALRVAGLLSRRAIRFLVLYAFMLSVLLWLCTLFVGVELAGCLAGLFVVIFAVAATRSKRPEPESMSVQKLPLLAFVPFAALMLMLFVTRLVPGVGKELKGITVPVTHTHSIALFYHAGFLLLLSAMVGLLVFPAARSGFKTLLATVTRQWMLATLAVASFIVFGQLMSDADMTGQIARSIASVSPVQYLFMVPVIGALGGFLTASNAASNALFMTLQTTAATELNLPADVVAASQNASGSNVTLASPGRLIFAASVIGEAGAEATLLSRVAPVTIAGVVSASAITYLMATYLV